MVVAFFHCHQVPVVWLFCTLHYKSTVTCDLVLYISLNWKNERRYITGKHVVCLGEKKKDFFKCWECFYDFILITFLTLYSLYSVVHSASDWVLYNRIAAEWDKDNTNCETVFGIGGWQGCVQCVWCAQSCCVRRFNLTCFSVSRQRKERTK